MRFNQPLNKILSQQSRVKTLRYLVQCPGEYTGREIARAIGFSHPIVHSALSSLRDEGVVLMRRSGRSLLFTLNKDHRLVKEIILPIFQKELHFKEKIIQLIVRSIKSPIESIILFGSIAAGKEKPSSDIDFLLVLPSGVSVKKTEKKLLDLNAKVVKQYGNQVSPVVMSKSEFLKRLKKKDKLLRAIIKKGEVVYGKSISGLIIKENV